MKAVGIRHSVEGWDSHVGAWHRIDTRDCPLQENVYCDITRGVEEVGDESYDE